MTTGNNRKDPSWVTFNADESFDFMRFVFEHRPLEFKKEFEGAIQNIWDDPVLSTMVSINEAIKSNLEMSGFFAGMVTGIALAMGCTGKPGKHSFTEFLETRLKKGENVADISEAFRKRPS